MVEHTQGTRERRSANGALRTLLRENGLSIAMFVLFLMCLAGQSLTGLVVHNEEAREHARDAIAFWDYVVSGDFVEAVFENWESEFLQMAVFVVLTKVLRQRGSSESKSLDESDPVDEDPRNARHNATQNANAPWLCVVEGWL